MGALAVEAEDAVEDEDTIEGAVEDEDTNDWWPRAAAIAAMASSRPAARTLRIRIRRGVARARLLEATPQSRRRSVASTYVVFDTPTIGGGSSIGACVC
jgi:hypothetical protein